MKFPLKIGTLRITRDMSESSCFRHAGQYWVCVESLLHKCEEKYVDSNGKLHNHCDNCWHKTFREAARAAVLHLYGDLPARLIDALYNDQAIYDALNNKREVELYTIQVLGSSPDHILDTINGMGCDAEAKLISREPIEIDCDYKWDGSFFETEKS